MDKAELKNRTKIFAHNCVKLSASLGKSPLGYHLTGQLIRCATSVAANYRAACSAQSRPTFIQRLGIVVEEADEALFWLEFIRDEGMKKPDIINPVISEADQLKAIFAASQKTARLNNPPKTRKNSKK